MNALVIQRTFNITLENFQDYERSRLRVIFSSPLLQDFFQSQHEEALKQITEIDPSKFTKAEAEKFLQACQEARSIAQFWKELNDFIKDWATNKEWNT